MRITIELLNRMDACTEQRRLFEEKFPTGVTVTPQVALAHADDGFDIGWAAMNMLNQEGRLLWIQRCSAVSRFLSRIHMSEGLPFNRQEVFSYLWDEYRRQQAVVFADLVDRYAKESVTSFEPEMCPVCGVVH